MQFYTLTMTTKTVPVNFHQQHNLDQNLIYFMVVCLHNKGVS